MTELLGAGRIDRVVVGVDFSRTGDQALSEALRVCQRLPAGELHVVHVVPVDIVAQRDARGVVRLASLLHARVEALRDHVAVVSRRTGLDGHAAVQRVFHVRIGDIADALHQVEVEVRADLVVIGTRAHDLLETPLGRVAEALVDLARAPVLVARPASSPGFYGSLRPAQPLRTAARATA